MKSSSSSSRSPPRQPSSNSITLTYVNTTTGTEQEIELDMSALRCAASQNIAAVLNNPYDPNDDEAWSLWSVADAINPWGESWAKWAGDEAVPSLHAAGVSVIPDVTMAEMAAVYNLLKDLPSSAPGWTGMKAPESDAPVPSKRKGRASKKNEDRNRIATPSSSIVVSEADLGTSDPFIDIPDLFFNPNFTVSESGIFFVTHEQDDASNAHQNDRINNDGSKDIVDPNFNVSLVALQEKFNNFLDIAEVHLLNRISNRFHLFFKLLLDLDAQQADLEMAIDYIRGIRWSLRSVDTNLCDQGLEIGRLMRKRANLKNMCEYLQYISDVSTTRDSVTLLMSNDDYNGALDAVGAAGDTLGTKLAKVKCVRGVDNEIKELTTSIFQTMTDHMVEAATCTNILIFESETMDDDEVTFASHASLPTNVEINEAVDRLRPFVVGVMRVGTIATIINIICDGFCNTIKRVTTKHINVLVSECQGNVIASSASSSIEELVAEVAKDLNQSQFFQFCRKLFQSHIDVLRRALIMHTAIKNCIVEEQVRPSIVALPSRLLKDVAFLQQRKSSTSKASISTTTGNTASMTTKAVSSEGPSPTIPPPTFSPEDSAQSLSTICDTAHEKSARLFVPRASLTARLTLQEFLPFMTMIMDYVTTGERLCGKQCYSLRGTILSHAKNFLENYHALKINKIQAILEQEPWNQADVAEEFQNSIDYIRTILLSSPRGRAASSASVFQSINQTTGTRHVSTSTTTAAPTSEAKAVLWPEPVEAPQHFKVASCVLLIAKMLSEYIMILIAVPSLSAEILIRIGELLKIYNNKTSELILRAGAMKTAGLKSITAKHLAITSQCLGLVIILIPSIRNIIVNHLPPRQLPLSAELDRIVKEYDSHRNEILAKLVKILQERIDFHCSNIAKDIPWDRLVSSPAPNNYVVQLLKETTVLYRVLTSILPTEQLQQVLGGVMGLINTRLVEHFEVCVRMGGGPAAPTTASSGKDSKESRASQGASTLQQDKESVLPPSISSIAEGGYLPLAPAGKVKLKADIDHLTSGLRQLKGLNGPFVGLDDFVKTFLS